MINKSPWRQQVDLILRVLPYVMQDERLALKGGTAINLFVREMPRLARDRKFTSRLMVQWKIQNLQKMSPRGKPGQNGTSFK